MSVLVRRATVRAVPVRRLQRAVRMTLRAEALRQGEVSVLVVDDPEIARLNAQWRETAEPTDVLAFSQDEGPLLGDIVMSAETVERQAAAWGHTLADELEWLCIHGTLHLLGWDDATPAARRRMHQRQAAIVAALRRAEAKTGTP